MWKTGAAKQIGDDASQKGAGRAVVPESFTHGSSEQRVRWFKRGIETGDVQQCVPFQRARCNAAAVTLLP